jgi:hypothetical protein
MSAGFKLPNRAPPSSSGGSSPSPSSSPPQLSPATASSAQSLISQLFSENESVRNENAALRKSLEEMKVQLSAAQAGAQQLNELKTQNSQLTAEVERANQSIQELQLEIESQSQQVMQAQQAAQQAAAAAAAAAAAFANPSRPAAASTSLGIGGAPINRSSVVTTGDGRAASASVSRGQFKPGTSGVPPPSDSQASQPAQLKTQQAQANNEASNGNDASVGMSRAMIRRKSRAQIQANNSSSDDMAGKDTVTALYDYTAQRPEEVSFKEGDVFVVTEKDASGWWKGIVRGQEGLFPSNYTKSNAA